MYCSKCGNKLQEGAKFCSSCGTLVEVKEEKNERKVTFSGTIEKCPWCGEKIMKSFLTRCESCGYEFRNQGLSSSFDEFSKKLIQEKDLNTKLNLIQCYAIPNNKEDLIEFMIFIRSNIMSADKNYDDVISNEEMTLAIAWKNKFDQCYEKSLFALKGDNETLNKFAEYKIEVEERISQYKKNYKKTPQNKNTYEYKPQENKNYQEKTIIINNYNQPSNNMADNNYRNTMNSNSYNTRMNESNTKTNSYYNQNKYNEGDLKNKWVALALCLFLGWMGMHKFYEGKIKTGILYMFTGGLFYIGWVIDIFKILGKPTKYYAK